MRRIPVESIPLHQALQRPLFHESGHVVLHEGERLSAAEIDRLLLNGIRKLYDLGSDAQALAGASAPGASAAAAASVAAAAASAAASASAAAASAAAAGGAGASPGGPAAVAGPTGAISASGTFVRVRPADLDSPAPPEVQGFLRDRRAARVWRELERALPRSIAPERLCADPKGELRNGHVARMLERSRAGEDPQGQGLLAERLAEARPASPRPPSELDEAREARRAAVIDLAGAFAGLRAGEGGEHDRIARIARGVLEVALRDPDLSLALRELPEPTAPAPAGDACAAPPRPGERPGGEAGEAEPGDAGEGDGAAAALSALPPEPADLALARHSIHVASLAVIAATLLGHDLAQSLELCHGALLHDIGMLRLPPALLAKESALDAGERAEVERHPIHALAVLRRFDRVPISTPSIAYCEHERPDGSGYPHGAEGEPGPFARIVAVCDVLEALGAERPHRKALRPHAAVREAVALASKRRLDAGVLRALLKAVGFYPVGSWVGLSDGRRGRVVGAGADPHRPVIALLDERGGFAPRPALLHLSDARDLRITETDLDAPAGCDPLAGF